MAPYYVKDESLREAASMRFRAQSKGLLDAFEQELKAPPDEQMPEEAAPVPIPEAGSLGDLKQTMPDTGQPAESVDSSQMDRMPETPESSGLPTFEQLTSKWTTRPAQATPAPATPSRVPDSSARRPVQQASVTSLYAEPGQKPEDDPAGFLPSLRALAGRWMPPEQAGQGAQQPRDGTQDASGAPSLLAPLQSLTGGRSAAPGVPGVSGTTRGASGPLPPLDTNSPEAFIRTATPYARRAEAITGVPAALALAVAANESGWGKHALGNNLFGIQAQAGEPGNEYTDLRPDGTPYKARLKSFADPTEAFAGFGQFLTGNSRYADAIARYKQSGDATQLATDISAAGYNEARLEGPWAKQIGSLIRQITPQMQQVSAEQPAAPTNSLEAATGPQAIAEGPNWKTQWSRGLTPDQIQETLALGMDYGSAIATCGIAGAVALARAKGGKPPTFGETLALAQQLGEWNKDVGMTHGYTGELALLKRLGIEAHAKAIDEQEVARAVSAGQPVEINATGNGGHYYVAEEVRRGPRGLEFNFGNSAGILKRAKQPDGSVRTWFRLDELPSLGVGTPTNAIFIS